MILLRKPIFNRYLILTLILLGSSLLLKAQKEVKLEKESPLELARIPREADSLIRLNLSFNKMNWILEESEDRESFEAKLKSNKKWISIEFTALGVFEDIEVKIGAKEMNPELLQAIEEKLKKDFGRFKIEKIQAQYKGDLNLLLKNKPWERNALQKGGLTAYELVVFGAKEKTQAVFEYLFNLEGELISRKQILPTNNDNLLY